MYLSTMCEEVVVVVGGGERSAVDSGSLEGRSEPYRGTSSSWNNGQSYLAVTLLVLGEKPFGRVRE